VTIHCGACGGENVRKDAYAEWNVELQQWELSAIFDHTVCDDCGCEDSAIEKVIES
jgi:hypothetical protein